MRKLILLIMIFYMADLKAENYDYDFNSYELPNIPYVEPIEDWTWKEKDKTSGLYLTCKKCNGRFKYKVCAAGNIDNVKCMNVDERAF